jgi:biotin carboxylase
MNSDRPLTILCLASHEKGHDFLRQAKEQGCRVLLITSLSIKEEAKWPREAIDDIFYMSDVDKKWNRDHTLLAVSHLARTESIDRIVPLDDLDLELAATLREHLRVPGMGETTTRYFRDKLSMRMRAREGGLEVPDFVHALNAGRIREFTERTPAPWVLKPRLLAGSMGIRKVHDADQLGRMLHELGDEQFFYLVERYVAGQVCHVDTIVYEKQIHFAIGSIYGKPPLDVSQGGGVFTTRTVERGSELEQRLLAMNARVIEILGLVRGLAHAEFIVGEDGKLYFLEIAARVGGAHIADLIEAATGLNVWREWAKIEIALGKAPYAPPAAREDYAGLVIRASRQEHPDTSAYNDPEVVWRLDMKHHAGLVVRSPSHARVQELVASYSRRFVEDF